MHNRQRQLNLFLSFIFKPSQIKTLLFLILFTYGCTTHELYRNYSKCIPGEEGIFYADCDSASFTLSLNKSLKERRVGPWFYPFFSTPIPGDGRIIKVYVKPTSDNILEYFDPPVFSIRTKDKKELVKPKTVRKIKNGFPEYGYWYLFEIDYHNLDSLVIEFTEKYHGCELPNILFIASRAEAYKQF